LIPGPKAHHRLREKCANNRIVWMLLPQRAHGVGVSTIEGTAVFGLRVCVPVAERLDEFTFHRRGMRSILLREAKG
jgi:hypothetical protein